MNDIVWIDGVGYCKEVTTSQMIWGVTEPYTYYEPINTKYDK